MLDNSDQENTPNYEYYFECITPNLIEFLRNGGVFCRKLNPIMFKKAVALDTY